MIEPKVAAMAAVTDPREWKRVMLDAASRGPTAIDEATGTLYVLRHRDIEQLLHEPRVHGVGLSIFDAYTNVIDNDRLDTQGPSQLVRLGGGYALLLRRATV